MTTVHALLLAAAIQPSALEVLKGVRDHYQSLTSFSARVEHRDSSGFLPHTYSHTLQWRRGGRFELLLVNKANFAWGDFYGDGRFALLIGRGNVWWTEELVAETDTIPPWEQCSWPILGWLQNTSTGRQFIDPPEGSTKDWIFGPRTMWQGQKVRELWSRSRDGRPSPFSAFVDPRKKLLIGLEYERNTWIDSTVFTDQKLNPALPASLGDSPADEPEVKGEKAR